MKPVVVVLTAALLAAGCEGLTWREGSRPQQDPNAPYAVLADALRSAQPPLQAFAAEVFLEVDRRPPRGSLERLADSPEYRVRVAVLAALGVTRRPELMPLFKRKRRDSEPVVRLTAAFGLAMGGDASGITLLRDGLSSPNVTLRRTAAWLLGLMQNPSAVALLRVKLDDPDAVVVLRAAEAIHRLGSGEGAERVRTLQAHRQHQIRAFATRLLGRMGAASDIPRLERLCQSRSLDVKFAAVAALARLGDFKRIAMLVNMVAAPDRKLVDLEGLSPRQVRVLAARELGETDYEPALEALASLMAKGDPLERTTAAGAMARIMSDRTPWRNRALEVGPAETGQGGGRSRPPL